MKTAIFDIGTNSIHMLVVEIQKDLSFEILDHEKDVTRLGDGSFEKKRLAKPVMRRALDVLDRFNKIADKNGVNRKIAVATSAVREAQNSGEFIQAVFKRTGLKIRVITGHEEGRLIYLAAKSSVETRGKKTLVIDIGGGSMELILGDQASISFLESFKLGVSRLTDHFIHEDPPSKKELKQLDIFIEKELKKAAKRIRKERFSIVIGTAGTMMSLASIAYYEAKHRPLQLVNHFELTRKDLERVHRRLIKMNLKERLKLPGLDAKRADITVAGSVLVLALMRLLKTESITISDKGIREGLILDFIEKNKKRLKGDEEYPDMREKSVRQLAKRCAYNETHAEHVTGLALRLFDKLAPMHGLGDNERELLRFSSLLHGIGHYVSYKKHHKHTHYLIVNSDLDGFSPEEVEIMGAVARHNRKPFDKKKDGHHVSKAGRQVVAALASILRIADGLDRSHFGVVKSLDCRVLAKSVTITVDARQDAELEIWQAKERSDLFERVFKRKVSIQTAK